jgi:hypothetical protein
MVDIVVESTYKARWNRKHGFSGPGVEERKQGKLGKE